MYQEAICTNPVGEKSAALRPGAAMPRPNQRFIPGLDGLRGLAVLAVIAAHRQVLVKAAARTSMFHSRILSAFLAIDLGDLGVSLFFVISGYLITTLLLKQINSPSGVSLREFYLRRLFRIFPPYYVYLGVICLLWAAGVVTLKGSAMASAFAYVSNYVPYQMTRPESSGWLVGHTWTLSLEEQFYLLWPVIVARLDRKKAAWIGIAALVACPVLRLVTFKFLPATHFDWQVVRMFHTRIDTIMAGSVLALFESKPAYRARVVQLTRRAGWLGFAFVALLIDLALNARHDRFFLLVGLTVEAGLLTFIMRCCIQQTQSRLGRALDWPVLRHIGVLSYSLYLWQQLFTYPSVIADRLHGVRGSAVLTLLLTLICAEISYFTVEKTSFTLRDRFLTPRQRLRPL